MNLSKFGLFIPQQHKWDWSTAPPFTAIGAVQKRGCTQMDEHLWPSNVPGPCGDPHSWCPETHSQWATVIDTSDVNKFVVFILVISLSLTHFCCFCLFCFSGALTQAIRNFAKSLEGWLNNAMNAIPQRMIQTKVNSYRVLWKMLQIKVTCYCL